jgi:DNA-binding NarL/FixJ family response regulator
MNPYRHATLSSTTNDHGIGIRHPDVLALQASSSLERLLQGVDLQTALSGETVARLGQESFTAGYAAGAHERRRAATEEAPKITGAKPTTAGSPLTELVAGLSPRRLEVLKLVARGLTNGEIAQVLGISSNTVKAHVAGVLEALDLTNRTEAAVALQEYETATEAPIDSV